MALTPLANLLLRQQFDRAAAAPRGTWHYQPAALERAQCGYVGLRTWAPPATSTRSRSSSSDPRAPRGDPRAADAAAARRHGARGAAGGGRAEPALAAPAAAAVWQPARVAAEVLRHARVLQLVPRLRGRADQPGDPNGRRRVPVDALRPVGGGDQGDGRRRGRGAAAPAVLWRALRQPDHVEHARQARRAVGDLLHRVGRRQGEAVGARRAGAGVRGRGARRRQQVQDRRDGRVRRGDQAPVAAHAAAGADIAPQALRVQLRHDATREVQRPRRVPDDDQHGAVHRRLHRAKEAAAAAGEPAPPLAATPAAHGFEYTLVGCSSTQAPPSRATTTPSSASAACPPPTAARAAAAGSTSTTSTSSRSTRATSAASASAAPRR